MRKAIHSFVFHSFKCSFTANPSAGITPVYMQYWSFPCSSVGKESVCSAGDLGSIPGLGRSPGVGNGNPLQYSCLGYPMDRGAWWITVHGVTKSRTQQLNNDITSGSF